MVITKRVGRKIIASIISSVILSIIIGSVSYDSPQFFSFLFIFMYAALYSVIIGVPCSIITDLIIYKIKGNLSYYVAGLILHLMFAGIVSYLFILADNTLKHGFFIYTVSAAAVGLWLMDHVIKKFRR